MLRYSADSIRNLLAPKSLGDTYAIIDEQVVQKQPQRLLVLTSIIPPEHILSLVGNESVKTLSNIERVASWLNSCGATRNALIFAVGGGALLDFVGLLAALYKRGVDVVYIPTTLLAMVDAAIGGKTAINMAGVKNLLGIIKQPKAVLFDESFLQSLPAEHVYSGYGELLKYGLLCGVTLWNDLLKFDPVGGCRATLSCFIEQAVVIKQRYVANDLYDNGQRRMLNLGHTLGHAFEAFSYSSKANRILLHGEAVIFGLIAELFISHHKLGCPAIPLHQLQAFVREYLSPFSFPCTCQQDILELVHHDKKNELNEVRMIGLRQIGKPVEVSVSDNELLAAIDFFND